MPEPLKNQFNEHLIRGMSKHFQAHAASFDADGFYTMASSNLSALELKQRSEHIVKAMLVYLPSDFIQASEVILASLSPAKDGDIFAATVDETGIAGWAIMPMTHYVGLQGQHHVALAMTLLKELTKRFSAEFGVRFFLHDHAEETMRAVKIWAQDSNRHVRRLASEGIRPRLPWAAQIPQFIMDPSPVIEVLELLKDDKEAYVRRSVANNLNDIAKDHPDLVADIVEAWMQGASEERFKLLRHACRTLLKQGNQRVLHLFGYGSPNIKQVSFKVLTPEVVLGHHVMFSLSCCSSVAHNQPLMIDYVIHHRKANGQRSPKVFKWRTTDLKAGETLVLAKKHGMKKISTRQYYAGKHVIEIMVNGVVIGKDEFQLLLPPSTKV